MSYLKNVVVLLCIFLMAASCKKEGVDNTAEQVPSDLVINANASTDGSGKVDFRASAKNAVSYVFEFGNGEIKTVASGITTYQYTLAGNNTYTVTVTASSSNGKTIRKSVNVAVNVLASSAGLIWSDEFNTDGAPDASKWGYDIGNGSNGWGNAELQYYTSRPENVSIQNGILKITAKKESYNGNAYTSTRMLSKNKFSFKYGRVEARAKLPAGVGTWPAIWMLGSNIETAGWPGCGEIDIMEHKGSELNKIYGTFHYPGRSGGNANGNTKMISNATTEFHIYSLDWSAAEIKIFVDGQLIHSLANSNSLPFNHDFFIILNVAMGGNFAGNVDPAFTSASMEIDYIRVYKQ